MKSGRPQVVSKYSTAQNGPDVNTKGVCPAALGSKDEQPAAFSPKTKLFYVPTNHVCMRKSLRSAESMLTTKFSPRRA